MNDDAPDERSPSPSPTPAGVLFDLIKDRTSAAHGAGADAIDWAKVRDGVDGAVAALRDSPELAAQVLAGQEPTPA